MKLKPSYGHVLPSYVYIVRSHQSAVHSFLLQPTPPPPITFMSDAQETNRAGTSSYEHDRKLRGFVHMERVWTLIPWIEAMALFQLFCNSSGLTFNGGSFNITGRDTIIHNAGLNAQDCT